MSTYKKGASPRQLSVRELHRELRRADLIIMTALAVAWYIADFGGHYGSIN